MMRKSLWLVAIVLILVACGAENVPVLTPPAGDTCSDCVIQSARLDGDYVSIPYVGDIWTTTWANDDNLYAAFGDATGMNGCFPTLLMNETDEFDADYIEVSPGLYTVADKNNEYCEVFSCDAPLPLCQYTPAGLVRLSGNVPRFAPCDGPDQCVVSRHLPYGDMSVIENSDKPSSVVSVSGRMYMPMHYPPGKPTLGYLAYSDDNGRTWQKIPNSPWGADSHFRVLMFINMGQDYRLNEDGYLYGLGIDGEVADPPQLEPIYLTRVRRAADGASAADDPVLKYANYQYFTGTDENGQPKWSSDQNEAVPLNGLETLAQASAMYHPDLRRYLFLSGWVGEAPGTSAGVAGVSDNVLVGALYEAAKPWGPWHKVAFFPGGFIANMFPKGTTPDGLYFAAAGGGGLTYNLNVGHLKLTTR